MAAEQNLRKVEIDMLAQECFGAGKSHKNVKSSEFDQKLNDEALQLHEQLKKVNFNIFNFKTVKGL